MVRIKHRYLLVNILYPNSAHHPQYPSAHVVNLPIHTPLLHPSILAFHAPTPSDLTPQLLLRAIRDQIALLYGDYGIGVTGAGGGLSVKYFSPSTSTFILRSPRAHYRLVWAALTLTTHLPSASKVPKTHPRTECVMRVVRVSGTIRKVEEEAIRRARGDILRARREEGEGEAMGTGIGVGLEEIGLDAMVGVLERERSERGGGNGDEEAESAEESEEESMGF